MFGHWVVKSPGRVGVKEVELALVVSPMFENAYGPCMMSFFETHSAACREEIIRAAAHLALPALRCATARLTRHAAMTPTAQPPSASPISGRCPWLPSRPPLPGAMPAVRYGSHLCNTACSSRPAHATTLASTYTQEEETLASFYTDAAAGVGCGAASQLQGARIPVERARAVAGAEELVAAVLEECRVTVRQARAVLHHGLALGGLGALQGWGSNSYCRVPVRQAGGFREHGLVLTERPHTKERRYAHKVRMQDTPAACGGSRGCRPRGWRGRAGGVSAAA